MSIDPKVSIGLPVYNGEKFLKKRLDSILSQTLETFELIISDNASTDSTADICKEFASKDTRIHYFRQEYNIGPIRNFKYVLDKAQCDYFVWASVDDIWLPEFLEENIKILDKNKKIVGSISKIEEYGKKIERRPPRFLKKIRYVSYDDYPKSGSYKKRIVFYLKLITGENIYAVFRTEELKKSFVEKPMGLNDKATLLNILKLGEINMIDKVLMHRFTEGYSRTVPFKKRSKELFAHGVIGRVFPIIPFTYWCLKNLGLKIFLKNLDYFLYINYAREKLLLKLFARKIQNKIVKKGTSD